MKVPGEKQMSSADVDVHWDVRIPLRDGIHLSALVYRPRQPGRQCPAIVTLTPYVAQTYHDIGLYFAAHGYPFLSVDVRGRGNSEGVFTPCFNEAADGTMRVSGPGALDVRTHGRTSYRPPLVLQIGHGTTTD